MSNEDQQEPVLHTLIHTLRILCRNYEFYYLEGIIFPDAFNDCELGYLQEKKILESKKNVIGLFEAETYVSAQI